MDNMKIAAAKCLTELGIDRFPIDFSELKGIAEKKGWYLKPYSSSEKFFQQFGMEKYAAQHDAFSLFLQDGTIAVFFRDTLSTSRRLQIVAHEYAHILLEHTCVGTLGKADDAETETAQEVEADEFAAYFLAPPCILKKCHVKTITELEEFTLTNGAFAKQLFANLRISSSCFHPEEVKLLNQCSSFIKLSLKSKMKGKKSLAVIACAAIFVLLISTVLAFYLASFDKPEPSPTSISDIEPNNSLQPTPVPSADEDDDSEIAVYWTQAGQVYHTDADCRALKQVTSEILSGTLTEAKEADKYRLCKFCEEKDKNK